MGLKKKLTNLASFKATVSKLVHSVFWRRGLIETGSWFHFYVKYPIQQSLDQRLSHIWYSLTFFTRWSLDGRNVVLCFDPPSFLRDGVLSCLSMKAGELSDNDPFSVHVSLVEETMDVYNRSVWGFRDLVREIEIVSMHVLVITCPKNADLEPESDRHYTSAARLSQTTRIIEAHNPFLRDLDNCHRNCNRNARQA